MTWPVVVWPSPLGLQACPPLTMRAGTACRAQHGDRVLQLAGGLSSGPGTRAPSQAPSRGRGRHTPHRPGRRWPQEMQTGSRGDALTGSHIPLSPSPRPLVRPQGSNTWWGWDFICTVASARALFRLGAWKCSMCACVRECAQPAELAPRLSISTSPQHLPSFCSF